MNKIYLFIALSILVPTFVFGQSPYWEASDITSSSKLNLADIKNYRTVGVNMNRIRNILAKAPYADANYKTDIRYEISIPNPKGGSDVYRVMEIAVLSPALAAEYPTLKTYKIIGSKGATGRITLSDFGMEVAVHNGTKSFHLQSTSKTDNKKHIIYYDRDEISEGLSCATEEIEELNTEWTEQGLNKALGDCQLRTYRMAVATTGEYTTAAGSQAAALAKVTSTINNISAIYERDATITFTVVSTTALMFPNAATDPFNTSTFPGGTALNDNHNAITSALGTAGFDLGHAFHEGGSGGSGLAQLSSVCNAAGKGRAASRRSTTTGGAWERLVSHEISHNFSGRHTMAANTGSCMGNVTTSSAYEVGGGSTIMAYASACTGASYQSGTDSYFHTGTISQMVSFAANSTCAAVSTISNGQPSVSSGGSAYTIPANTPFILSASGTDSDGDNVLYNWEQMDPAPAPMGGFPSSSNTAGPMFRSYPPSADGDVRYLPALSNLVTGTSVPWEVLPTVSRTMDFRITARDNAAGNGCLAYDSTIVTTNNSAGPFTVTSQSTPTTWVGNGTNTATITWNTAGTNNAPISCANVDILFSDDEGQSFPHVLLASTPNDGSQSITIPSLNACRGRIMVKCSDNIFFNINSEDIDLSSSCLAEGTTFSPTNSIVANGGSPALNFTEAPNYGSPATISGSVTTADPQNSIVCANSSGGCFGPFNSSARYDLHTFNVNIAGNYTFTVSTGLVINLYQGSYNPTAHCTNWIASSASYNGSTVSIGTTMNNVPLCPGTEYIMVVTTFNGTNPGFPAPYTVTASTVPPGGGIFTATPDPGAAYAYDYTVVDKTSGNIVNFSSSPIDMTSSSTHPPGNYEVFGLSHSTANTLTALNTAYSGTSYSAFTTAALGGAVCANPSSNSRLVTILTPLPINASELLGTRKENTSVLNWTTYQEKNTYQFEIERSIDGVAFETIGKLDAAGNSSTNINYDFVDTRPRYESNFYRLKNVDMDGSFTYSNIVEVFHPVQETSFSLYPNPAKNTVNINIESKKVQGLDIVVTDLLGKLIIKERQFVQSGSNELKLSISNLASGNYLIRLKTNDSSVVKKLHVQ